MATAVFSGVRDFTVPRVCYFGQLVGHVVFTIPAIASAALYTSCDLMTLGTHNYFIRSIETCLTAPLPQKSLTEESKSAQERIDECVRDIAFSLIRTVNPAAKINQVGVLQHALPFPQTKELLSELGGTHLDSRYTSAGRLCVDYCCPIRIVNWVLKQQLKSNEYYLKGSPLNVRARLFSIASGVALAIAGIACVIFGALATIGAMLSCGKFDGVNNCAVNLVGMIGFSVNQLHQGVIGFFRPSHLVTPRLLQKKS